MTNSTKKVWVVRGGDNNELASQIASKGAVAIGWADVGDVSGVTSREILRERMEQAVPGSGTPNSVGQLFRFVNEIEIGDYVLTPEKASSTVHVTRATSAYRFDADTFGPAYPHVRSVEFLKTMPRKEFPQTVRNTLGSILTVFRADLALPYVEAKLGGPPLSFSATTDDTSEPGVWASEIDGQARGQILEALDEIDHHDFQIFVCGVLQAMGYRATPGAKGKDGGVDFLAYQDAFGLASPRIKGQVKNQKASAGIQDVGYLNGVLGQGESGLFVCTGGFSKDAENAPFVKSGKVALVTGTDLLALIIEHYEAFPERAKNLLPLRRIYVPERVIG